MAGVVAFLRFILHVVTSAALSLLELIYRRINVFPST